ncbi:unnamed protein product [Urochloa humidicola]
MDGDDSFGDAYSPTTEADILAVFARLDEGDPVDGDGADSFGNAYSPMATEEPHEDPELLQPASPRTEADILAEIVAMFALFDEGDPVDGADSFGNAYSPMAIEEPHEDPELPQPASPTTEANILAEIVAMFARLDEGDPVDGADSFGNAYSPMAIEEPHEDPELPQPASPTTEANILAEIVAMFARLDEGDPVDGDGDAEVGADDAYAYGGFGAVPASGYDMAALPETTVGEGEEAEEGECAVCLERYEAGDALRTMPCAHAYHEHCIFGWLAVSRLCPLCRFAMPAEMDSDTEDEDDDDDNTEGEDDDDVE